MNKLIFTEWKGKIMTAWLSGNRISELSLEEKEDPSVLGHIYIGKVKNIVKNIGAAFVEFEGGKIGYYSLSENQKHLFADGRDCGLSSSRLKAGDEIVVQVARDSVKTKAPVLSSNLNFTGRYCVLTSGKDMVGFSAKITDNAWKSAMKPKIEAVRKPCSEGNDSADNGCPCFGVIVRTNAYEAGEEVLLEELHALKEKYRKLLSDARYRTCYTRLDESCPAFVTALRDAYGGEAEEIITDSREIYVALKEYLKSSQPENINKLTLYEDTLLPLSKLYSLDQALEKALSPRVWLKSGGYLVIEPTEALTVIDVNTGKFAGKKTPEETIFKINMEAAKEIGTQLRLRNLSGIIIVDFIDMKEETQKEELLSAFREICRRDHVKTTVVDITPLNLVEVTRKKIKRPLHEQMTKEYREENL